MNPLQIRLLSLALFAVLCATLTYWIVTLTSHSAPVAAAMRPSVSNNEAEALFGGKLARNANADVHLFGILVLQGGAAAIVSIGDNPPKAVSLGGPLAENATLADVRARSIVIDRSGAHSEVFLPANAGAPTIFVR
jgi:general secretion pathway protein C